MLLSENKIRKIIRKNLIKLNEKNKKQKKIIIDLKTISYKKLNETIEKVVVHKNESNCELRFDPIFVKAFQSYQAVAAGGVAGGLFSSSPLLRSVMTRVVSFFNAAQLADLFKFEIGIAGIVNFGSMFGLTSLPLNSICTLFKEMQTIFFNLLEELKNNPLLAGAGAGALLGSSLSSSSSLSGTVKTNLNSNSLATTPTNPTIQDIEASLKRIKQTNSNYYKALNRMNSSSNWIQANSSNLKTQLLKAADISSIHDITNFERDINTSGASQTEINDIKNLYLFYAKLSDPSHFNNLISGDPNCLDALTGLSGL